MTFLSCHGISNLVLVVKTWAQRHLQIFIFLHLTIWKYKESRIGIELSKKEENEEREKYLFENLLHDLSCQFTMNSQIHLRFIFHIIGYQKHVDLSSLDIVDRVHRLKYYRRTFLFN